MGRLEQIGREWLDTLVVAISVAMAFRAYFYEPFNIPTGSMQPTLYGNHVEECEKPGLMEAVPFKWLNWAVTGRDYKEFTAPFAGSLVLGDRGDGRFDVSIVSPTGAEGPRMCLPTDVVTHLDLGPEAAGRLVAPVPRRDGRKTVCLVNADGTTGREVRIPKGHTVFKGYDVTGDFIFVNRWRWNFRKPARGDVMVFATTGVGESPAGRYEGADGKRYELQQGTHYIKRMTGLPGETVAIEKPDVYIDGRKLDPLKPMTGARGEPTPEPNAGLNSALAREGKFTLGADEYYACGDNSDNSFDSRYWGAVPERNLRGVGSCVFWPLVNPRWGAIR